MKRGDDGENRQSIHPENARVFLILELFLQFSFACRYFPHTSLCIYYCAGFCIILFHLQFPCEAAGKTRHNEFSFIVLVHIFPYFSSMLREA